MNDLNIALICSAFQVTLFGSLAAVLCLLASRRAPSTAARVAAFGLGACVVLTIGSICPLPAWWSCTLLLGRSASVSPAAPTTTAEAISSSEENFSPSEVADLHGAAENPSMDWSLARLRDAWDNLARQHADAGPAAGCWPNIMPILFVSGVGLGLLRLGVGLWSVSRYRRRSRPIVTAVSLDVLTSLQRTVNCQRQVEIRESPDLSTPATVGWLRPLILLPSDWRGWTEDQLHAVLAHELAHIRRSDYAACLLARISLAVHFYHPLAYWLAGRLQFQQELAADEFGAVCLGGRERYLRALAGLLLREDARRPCWLARTFLSPSGTLLRRIEMLRVQDGSPRQRWPRWATALFTVALALAVVGISALRGPAQQSEDICMDANGTNAGSLIFGPGANPSDGLTGQIVLNERNFDILSPPSQLPSQPVPFDLAYMDPDAPGVVALRPGAFLRRPGMGLLATLAKVQFASILAECKVSKDAAPSLEAIEQVIMEAQLGRDDKAPKEQRNQLMFGLGMIRTEKDFDWKKLMQALMPDAEAVRYRGKTYYKGAWKAIGPGFDLCYFLPDGRTVVIHREKTMRRVLDNLAEGRRMLRWNGDWRRVEHGLMAIAFDSVRARKTVKDAEPDIAPLIEHTTHIVAGVDLNDLFAVRAFAACPDEKSAKTLVKWTRTQLVEAAAALDQIGRDEQNWVANRLARDLLKQARVTQHGTKASLSTQTKITAADVGEILESSGMSPK